jgi:hypothetical protein
MRFLKQTYLILVALCCGLVISSCNTHSINVATSLAINSNPLWPLKVITGAVESGAEAIEYIADTTGLLDAREEPENRTELHLPLDSTTDYVVCIKATTASSGTLSWDKSDDFVTWVKEAKKRKLGLKYCKTLIEA